MQYLNDFSVMWNRKEARDAETNARYSWLYHSMERELISSLE